MLVQLRDDVCIMLVMFMLVKLRDDVGDPHHARYGHANTT
jgi:hypothetical protein